MTTEVTVKVPDSADYEAVLRLNDTVGEEREFVVKPGDVFTTYIYSTRFITSIRERPLTT